LSVEIVDIAVQPDTVHITIGGNRDTRLPRIVGEIKGYTSYMLRREFPELQKGQHLWARYYSTKEGRTTGDTQDDSYLR